MSHVFSRCNTQSCPYKRKHICRNKTDDLWYQGTFQLLDKNRLDKSLFIKVVVCFLNLESSFIIFLDPEKLTRRLQMLIQLPDYAQTCCLLNMIWNCRQRQCFHQLLLICFEKTLFATGNKAQLNLFLYGCDINMNDQLISPYNYYFPMFC